LGIEIPCIELLHYVDQIRKFGSHLSYYFGGWLCGIILEGQAQETKPSKRINGHPHRVQHDILILILILICSQGSWQFGLVLPGRYCSLWVCLSILWNKLAVFG
jgi:hypothetical protein